MVALNNSFTRDVLRARVIINPVMDAVIESGSGIWGGWRDGVQVEYDTRMGCLGRNFSL